MSIESRLTSTQRKYLRGLAHPLNPLVQVGQAGLTAGVIEAARRALADHELIKVKLGTDRDERARMTTELETACDACVAGTVGRIAILYRPKDDPAERRIVLPGVDRAG